MQFYVVCIYVCLIKSLCFASVLSICIRDRKEEPEWTEEEGKLVEIRDWFVEWHHVIYSNVWGLGIEWGCGDGLD